ncbi:MAG: glycosyltransferase family 4 protein [Caldilineaceae bacterium]
MRILFLSNLFPPHGQGGYEEWCQEVAIQLREQEHEVIVLTSRHTSEGRSADDPNWVRRELHLEMELASLRNSVQFFTHRRRREQENLEILRSYISRFQPEAVVIWGMWNMVRSLPVLVEKLLPNQVVYYMGDYWPSLPNQFEYYWQTPTQHWLTQIPKSLLGVIARIMLAQERLLQPRFRRVLFPTNFMRQKLMEHGLQPKESVVIYGAADIAPYAAISKLRAVPAVGDSTEQGQKITLLCASYLRAEKGVHIAINALARLVHDYNFHNLELVIVGGGEQDYITFLEYLIRRHRLEGYVTFLGPQPKAVMPGIYQRTDVFLFTSVWQEPFGQVIVEAMAAGVPVVGSLVGGVSEILVENETGLTFPPDDAERLAAQVARLVRSPELREQLGRAGQIIAVERFDIHRMGEEIEAYLLKVVQENAT